MSRWAKLQQSQALFTQIQQIYTNTFPLEVRHFLSEWIEEQPWFDVQENNPEHEQYAQQLLTQLLTIVEAKAESFTGDLVIMKFKLQETILILRNLYGNNAMGLIKVMKQCLKQEEELIQHVEGNVQNMTVDTNAHDHTGYQITMDLEKLAGKTATSDSELKKLQEKQESFIIQYQDNLKINDQMRQLNQNQVNNLQELSKKKKQLMQQKENLEMQLTQKAQQLLLLRIKLADFFVETVKDLQEVQKKVLDDELIRWKRGQQLAGNGAPFDSSFKLLQQWCETLAELIWNNRQQIKGVSLLRVTLPIDLPPGQVDHLPGLLETITSLLSSLVTSTFIVETQPPQVMKKDSRFTASVRLLVGGKLNVHMNPPQVKATIISENQAKNLLQTDVKAKNETSGEILNNVGTMEYQQTTGQLSINFRNMQLKRIKRSDRKGTDAVTEEKFCILFQSDFSIGGNELVFQVWSLSLPVVVTVHGNQESNALATVLWDNAFSEHGRVPFQVPESVPWPKLAEQLNIKFQSGTGRGLSDDNIQYLASKIFNGPIGDDYNSRLVSWSQFNKDALPSRNFTFWEWFYAMYKLTMQHLKEQWNDGSILGFVSKAKAQEWLLARPNGTFLLRFSDSEIGGITIAWVQAQAETEVWNLAPFVAKDFVIRSLSDRIKDLSNLVWLYPDTPKDTAFSKYYTQTIDQPHQSQDGYIKPHLVNVITNWNPPGAVMNSDNPQTPQIMNPVSPNNSLYDAASPVSTWSDAQLSMNIGDNFEMDEITMMQSNTDYNPDDIDSINVNELLTNCYPNQTGV